MKNLIRLGGWLLIFFSAAHYFIGFPMITGLLESEGVSSDLDHTVRVTWKFSSLTMLLTGIWALSIYRNRNYTMQCLILGVPYLIFGCINLFNPFPNWHLFLFALPGLMIALPGIRNLI